MIIYCVDQINFFMLNVHIYSRCLSDMDNMKHDILSRPWFTYRRGFSAIGTYSIPFYIETGFKTLRYGGET